MEGENGALVNDACGGEGVFGEEGFDSLLRLDVDDLL